VRKQRALNRIEYILRRSFNYTCEQIGLEPPANYVHDDMAEEEERMNDPTNIGDDPVQRGQWQATVERNLRLMTPAQRSIYDRIMESVRVIHADPLNEDVCRYRRTRRSGQDPPEFHYHRCWKKRKSPNLADSLDRHSTHFAPGWRDGPGSGPPKIDVFPLQYLLRAGPTALNSVGF